jgi:uncharacterized protein (DUF2164 family)
MATSLPIKGSVPFLDSSDLYLFELVASTSQAAHMTITLTKEARAQAVASIERYFLENMEDKIGNIAAGALLGFFLEELGPLVYNQAVAEVQERLQQRVSEIDIEVHEEEFAYWRNFDKLKKGK